MTSFSESTASVILGLLVLGFIVRSIWINTSMIFARIAATKNPSEQNAYKVYKLLSKKFGVSINNHPKDWAKFRDMFYHINNSCEVPAELKEKIKARLIKKGLYINNMRINDNFKGGKQI